MNQEAYYKCSKSKKLPPRCPILNLCMRRAETINLFTHQMKLSKNDVMGLLTNDDPALNDQLIPVQGEDVTYAGGTNNFIFSNTCPEVALFDNSNSWGGFNKVACSKGQYDKYMDPQDVILEYKHFSECAEFSYFTFMKGNDPSNASKTANTSDSHNMTDLNSKIDEIISLLKKNDLGNELIYDELQEMKEAAGKIDLKNWKQLLKGKLLDLVTDKAIALSPTLANDILKTIDHHTGIKKLF